MFRNHTNNKVTYNLLKWFTKMEEENSWEDRHWQTYYKSRDRSRGRSCSVGANHNTGNRYCDVFPYNDTRVVLHKLNGNSLDDDYINASYVTLPVIDQKVICAQGPMDHTKDKFWYMVWQEDSRVIVMLAECDCKDSTPYHLRLSPYWPTGSTKTPANKHLTGDVIETAGFKVELLLREENEHYVYTKLNITEKMSGENRQIFHFQFLGWPDFGVPSSPTRFLELLYAAREYYSQSPGPIVVHCLAGIGRTGTYVLVDAVLGIVESKHTVNVDVESVLLKIRDQRVAAVQMPEQFRFAMLAVVEGVDRIQQSLRDTLELGEDIVV